MTSVDKELEKYQVAIVMYAQDKNLQAIIINELDFNYQLDYWSNTLLLLPLPRKKLTEQQQRRERDASINPLLHIGHYSVHMAKISILNKNG